MTTNTTQGLAMLRVATVAGFIATVLAANYVTTEYGMVPVGFGLVATAGTYFAGLAFVLRDAVQDTIRASLPDRVVFVDTYHEVTASGGIKRLISTGVRREVRPPRDRAVALRVFLVIALGAGLSYFVADPFIALASGVAFLASETADLAVYTPLRERGYVRAAVASNVVGAFVDTVLFLWIAGFPIRSAIAGQMVGKLAITLAVVALVLAVRGGRKAVAA